METSNCSFAIPNVPFSLIYKIGHSKAIFIRVTPLSLTKKFCESSRETICNQKVSVTHYYICLLLRLSSFTDKFAKVLYFNSEFCNFFAIKPCRVLPVESRQQSCDIESQQQFFRCSNCDRIFVSETCSKWSQNYSVSESEGAPFYSYVVFTLASVWSNIAKFSGSELTNFCSEAFIPPLGSVQILMLRKISTWDRTT